MNLTNIKEIPIDTLLEHPENSNVMDAIMALKLKKHIQTTGRYEPLTVRPHPSLTGKYQVINGHNRLRILRLLEYKIIYCVVWHLDDKQTRLYLATLNRLSGRDIPERRALLIDNLLRDFGKDELVSLLPDNKNQLEQLEKLTQLDFQQGIGQNTAMNEIETPVILNFIMTELEAKDLNLALDLILKKENCLVDKLNRSQALVLLARLYLKNIQPKGIFSD